MKIQVKSEIELDFNEILDGIARLQQPELDTFVAQVMAIQARRRAPSLSKREAELLQKINQGIAPSIRTRFHHLNERLHEEIITEDEQQEFLGLSDQIEIFDAERLKYLIELAQLRQVGLDQLMIELGIQATSYV